MTRVLRIAILTNVRKTKNNPRAGSLKRAGTIYNNKMNYNIPSKDMKQ